MFETSPSAPVAVGHGVRGPRCPILLAEAHPVLRAQIRALLEVAGLEVVSEVSNGQQARRIVRELEPQIAILDLTTPELEGLEAGRAILEESPNVGL